MYSRDFIRQVFAYENTVVFPETVEILKLLFTFLVRNEILWKYLI